LDGGCNWRSIGYSLGPALPLISRIESFNPTREGHTDRRGPPQEHKEFNFIKFVDENVSNVM
jgi:hypothetical protein